jgi:tRNA-specific 2-thiouridylase
MPLNVELAETATVVAMSGGVDSSVAAMMLARNSEIVAQGLIGVSMQVWDYRRSGGALSRATCCAPSDFDDARRVAGKVGIPYYVMDLEEEFRASVIAPFISQYESGFTPNPCVECNRKVKFKELRRRSLAMGCSKVATGHYAQILNGADGLELHRAVDRIKDQSYFLFGLTNEELASTLFPVGALTKPEVRELATQAGLVTAEKPESQDICFVSGTVADFIRRHSKSAVPAEGGRIVNVRGELLGYHSGIHRFTVGQRKGLGLPGGSESALYVLEIRAESNEVVVGERAELERSGLVVRGINWLVAPPKDQPLRCIAQLRHRHGGVPVEVSIGSNPDEGIVKFVSGWAPVSPGQATVLYDTNNSRVLAGGTTWRALEARAQRESEGELGGIDIDGNLGV